VIQVTEIHKSCEELLEGAKKSLRKFPHELAKHNVRIYWRAYGAKFLLFTLLFLFALPFSLLIAATTPVSFVRLLGSPRSQGREYLEQVSKLALLGALRRLNQACPEVTVSKDWIQLLKHLLAKSSARASRS
jgi:hypothetical protein